MNSSDGKIEQNSQVNQATNAGEEAMAKDAGAADAAVGSRPEVQAMVDAGTPAQEPGSPVKETMQEHKSPVSEAKKYRRRAQQAEKSLEDARKSLEAAQIALRERDEAIAALQRQRMIDEALCDAGSLDLPTVRVLVEQALANAAGELTAAAISTAVEAVRKKVSHLFQGPRHGRSGAMGPRDPHAGGPARSRQVEEAAETAVQSGRRMDLLSYLRLRRRRH